MEAKSPRSLLRDFDKTPADYHYWSKKKQLEFQRRKMVKLKDYWHQEKELVKTTKKKSFLNNYSKGEMNLFEDYIEKMISSKSAEIFR